MNTKLLLSTFTAMLFSMASAFSQTDAPAAPAAPAAMTSMLEALDKAMQHEQIVAKGDKVKLYQSTISLSEKRSSWSFTFYDGGSLLHTVRISSGSKPYYNSRDKGSSKIFEELDFSKIPAPKEAVLADMVEKAKKVLTALELNPSTEKMYINYSLRNAYKQKDMAIHSWSISMLTGDGTSGKTVAFQNGEFFSVNPSMIKK